MNQDSFKQLEALFHELNNLSPTDRTARLEELSKSDSDKSTKLQSMFALITRDPDFLDPSAIEERIPIPVQIPVDGTVILADRYTIIECIGLGGSSTVFRAKATSPDRDVAIKMLRFGLSSQHARDRFDQESKALATLTHPHIAHIYQTGVYTDDDARIPWIAMELIHGSCTIMNHITKNNLDETQRVRLFTQVCEAIQAAHQSDVLHLDLNASNILIDSHGYPKIIDFGLAGLIYSTRPKNLASIGTRTSMAPEQTLYSSTPFDQRTDIYALGLMFIEILTGHQLQAFVGQTDEQTRHLIAMGKARELLTELDNLPEQYRIIIDNMIRVDPDDRYASVDGVLEQLREPLPSSKSRIPNLITATLVAAVLIFAGLIFSSRNNTRDTRTLTNTPNAIALSPELAIDLSSENPRNTSHSLAQDRIIDEISSSLDHNNSINPTDAIKLHSTLAGTHQIAGRYKEAISQYRKTISLLSSPSDTPDRNWTLLSLADMQIFLGRTRQAEESLAKIDRVEKLDPLFLLDLGIAETKVHISLNERVKARRQIEYTMSFLAMLPPESIQDRIERMISLGELLSEAGQSDASLTLLYDAKHLAENSFFKPNASQALAEVAIANVLFDSSSPETFGVAKKFILNAVLTFEAIDDQFHASWASRQLGNIYLALGDPQSALGFYTNAETSLTSLLGQDHHETIVCRAYCQLANIALASDYSFYAKAFTKSIDTLNSLLGREHPIIRSLKESENLIYSKYIPQDP